MRCGLAESSLARIRIWWNFKRAGRTGSAHWNDESRAAERPVVCRVVRAFADDVVGRQGNAERAPFADHNCGRKTGAGQRAGAARIAGKRIVSGAGRAGERGHFTKFASKVRRSERLKV